MPTHPLTGCRVTQVVIYNRSGERLAAFDTDALKDATVDWDPDGFWLAVVKDGVRKTFVRMPFVITEE